MQGSRSVIRLRNQEMEIALARVQRLECQITEDNFESVVKALETAFPFLRPFREVLAYCVMYVFPDQERVEAGELEVLITRWQQSTSEQMGGSFSMSFGGLFAAAKNPDKVGETVEFSPYRGDPQTLCKLGVLARKNDDSLFFGFGLNL